MYTTSKNPLSSKRNSTIEILRILAIFIIILSHFSVHGGHEIDVLLQDRFRNAVLLHFFQQGNLGTNLFIILTGYFMVRSSVHPRRILQLILQVWTTSVILYIVAYLIKGQPIYTDTILYACFPITFQTYWFFTAYIVLLLFSVLLNRAIKQISQKAYRLILLFFILFYSFAPFITRIINLYHPEIRYVDYFTSVVILFILLYLLGAYLRLYPLSIFRKHPLQRSALFFLIATLFLFLCVLSLDRQTAGSVLPETAYINSILMFSLFERSSPLVLVQAVSLVVFFTSLPETRIPLINRISGCVFGIYLLHDHPAVRPLLWMDLLHVSKYGYSHHLILRAGAIVVLVFLICLVIELLRQLVEARYMGFLSRVLKKDS